MNLIIKGYDSLLDDWLARSRSPHTKRMYRSNITAFFESLGHQITSDMLAQFLLLDSHQAFELVSQYHGSLVERSLAPATINQKLAAIKSLVNYASQAGKCHYTLVNIKAEKLTQYRDTKGIPKEQFKLMMGAVDTDTIKGLRDRAILFLLWGNTLRRSEIANCDISDFSPKAGELIITGKGKIGQPEMITHSQILVLKQLLMGETPKTALFRCFVPLIKVIGAIGCIPIQFISWFRSTPRQQG